MITKLNIQIDNDNSCCVLKYSPTEPRLESQFLHFTHKLRSDTYCVLILILYKNNVQKRRRQVLVRGISIEDHIKYMTATR